MSTTLVLVIVLVFSFVAGRVLRWVRRRFALPTAGLYAFVGIAVGPLGLGIVDERILSSLQPVLSLLLGLIGFGMGLMLRVRLRDATGLEAGFVGGLIVTAAVAGVTYGVSWLIAPADPWALLWPSLAVGATAAVSDAQLIGNLAARAGARGPVRELVRTMAVSSSIVAVSVLGLSLAWARARENVGHLELTPTEWLLAALAAGAACGVLFVLFIGQWANDQRAFLATVAIITFASGIASAMGISPLLAGMLAGLVASLASAKAAEVGRALDRLEAPAFVGIVVLAGAMWRPPGPLIVGMVLAYLAARIAALRLSGFVAPRLFPGLPRAHRLGYALLPQGALSAAIVANFAQVVPDQGAMVLTIGLVGLLVSDATGYRSVRRVLADSGEITHAASQPGLHTPNPDIAAPVDQVGAG